MRNAHLATKDSTSSLENGRIEGGLSSEVIKMKDDSPLSGPGELDLAKLVDEVLGEMPGPGSAESGKMPLYQPNTLPLEMSPHAARLALEEAQRAKEKRRKEAEELGQMKTAAAPMEVLDLQRAAAEAVVPGLAVQPKPASVVVVPAPVPAAAAASAKPEAKVDAKKVEEKKVEAKPIQVRSAEVKDSAKATVLTTAKALEKRSSAGRWVMIGMGLVAVAAASTAGWLAYKKSPLLGHASAATPAVTAPAATTAAATPAPEAHANATPASAAPEAKPPTTAEAKSEEPKPEAKAAAPEAKPAEAKAEEPAAPTTKPKRKVAASAPESKPAPEAKAEEPAPKPAPAAKAPEPKPAPAPVAAKAPEPKAETKPAAPPAQPSSVDAILQQQLKGAIP